MTDITDFDLADLAYGETLEYAIKHPVTGVATTWVWTIAGPSHPITIALNEKIEKRDREEESKFTQARIAAAKANKPEPERPLLSAHDRAKRNATDLAGRVINFTPVKLGGKLIEYSPDSVVELLSDLSKDWLFSQVFGAAYNKLGFIPNSAET
ncbi:hypothetical protein [Azospirillum sp. TSO5]|uniref:hypothetical protein n=1 Tax=Azospirillum sp. TSO5 TaxID=716760 RepID=UPI000D61BC1B|nr:hypothetical protein [Azospirillum sp. TSO5]PWC96967.1 hypothetical protein TSO5_05930 [Azospirillum sp. TSO5]